MQKVFEEWRDVIGYEGYYQVSNLGNVRSLDRRIECRGAMRSQKGKMLKPHLNNYGYKQVILYDYNKKSKLHKVHRLVAEAFILNPDNLPQVNHKDEDKGNNSVENLEWCTCLYNLTYNDLHHRRNNKNNKKSKPVLQIKDGVVVNEYPSIREVARVFGCSDSNIVECCKGKKKSIYGYQWRYKESEG